MVDVLACPGKHLCSGRRRDAGSRRPGDANEHVSRRFCAQNAAHSIKSEMTSQPGVVKEEGREGIDDNLQDFSPGSKKPITKECYNPKSPVKSPRMVERLWRQDREAPRKPGLIEFQSGLKEDESLDDLTDDEQCFSPDRNSNKPITNLYPMQMLEGTSGVYLLAHKDTGVGVAVFKPFDEENFPQEATSWAVSRGTGYSRERAAYVVSDQVLEGISEVPKTVIATVKFDGWPGSGEKMGSLQVFVPEASDMSDRGPANIPVEEVQKVGILDILLFNMDRHEGNLLLQNESDSLSLVPIDHGLCLPEIISAEKGPNHELLKSIYFVWQNWPQARQPFSEPLRRLLDRQLASDFLRQFVGKLRTDMDRQTLTCAALTTLKIGALVLRDSVRAGLSLSEIAQLVSTKLPEILQASWEQARKAIKTAASEVGKDQHKGKVSEDDNATSNAMVPVGRRQQLAAEEEEQLYLWWETELLSSLEVLLRAEMCSRMSKSAGARDDAQEHISEGAGCLLSRLEQDAAREKVLLPQYDSGQDVLEGHVDVVPNARFELLSVDAGAKKRLRSPVSLAESAGETLLPCLLGR